MPEMYRDTLPEESQPTYDALREMLRARLADPALGPIEYSPCPMGAVVDQVKLILPEGIPSPLVACLIVLAEMAQAAFDELVPDRPERPA